MGQDDKGTRGDILPLCYSSFELIQHMVKASKQKQKETEMVQARNQYKKEDDGNHPGDSSPATNTLGICNEVSSYEDRCSSLQMNMFSSIPPSEVSHHTRGIFLLGSTEEAGDLPLEAHLALVTEISSEKWDVPLKKVYVGPLVNSSKCHPD